MSSSQTMTAPAVGHRPPDAGPDMSSLFDYGRPHHHHHQEGQEQQQQEQQNHQQQRDNGPFSPRSDSADRALHDSTFNNSVSPRGLPSSSGMNGIKSEPSDAGNDFAGAQPDYQNDLRRQSAASALLAQLLGNQSSAPPAGTETQPAESSSSTNNPPNPTESSENNPSDQIAGGQGSTSVSTEISAPAESAAGQDQFSTSTDLPRLPGDGEKNREDRPADMSFPKSEESGNHGVDAVMKTPDPAEGLTDPMMFSKTGLNDSDLFTPFDIASAGKNPFDNEMLTSAYLSQSADLSAFGYSAGHLQDGTGSLGGSEPRIQAFAKLEFDDGHFYCNTYSFILGRDVRAARAAHQREFQARQAIRTSRAKSSSGGNASHTPVRVKHEGSGMIGSVVSDRGGIMGLDPDIPAHLPKRLSRRSSHSSEAGAPLHATPAQLQSTTDYNALAMQSLHETNGDAKPVDALALLPSPDACPTIPIHPPATLDGSAAGHRGISRKHVKIAYNFDKNLFEMEVMGRNGAFIGADWLSPGQVRPLHSGDYIQIGGVRIRFLLPDVPIGETGADRVEEPSIEENGDAKASVGAENDAEGAVEKGEGAEDKDSSKPTKLILKTKEPDASRPVPSIEGTGDGVQPPVRRRGPGRPPKDGIMSKRERAELAREQKLAAKREANGGVTPPPLNRPKAGKTTTTTTSTVGTAAATPSLPGEGESPGSKPEKRKYTKRKKPDGTLMDYPLPSTEGGPFPMEQRPEEFIKAPPVKKRKPSRSPSPNYPPESAYTPEDLAKPPYNYAVLIFDALTEAGTPMTLKQIYRALKLKYPYFRFKCETEGWTSSVRHNLNGNSHLFMHAERDGKGWSWQLRPGASVEKEKKRRPSPPPPSQPPSVPASAPQYMPPLNPSYGNPQNGQSNLANQHFQFPTMPPNTYAPPTPAPASSATAPPSAPPRHLDPYPPPHPPPQAVPASAPFPIPSPLRNNLPPAFAQTTPSTYTSPYASDPPPQLAQFQQPQQPQQPQQQPGMHSQSQHHSPYPPHNATAPPPPQQQQHVPPPPPGNPQQPQQYLPPNPGPPMQPPQQQQQPNYNVAPMNAGPTPMGDPESVSFEERASKAIDDFEAVLLEDYEDKNHIKEVLKSARARALGHATESSFPGGEPKDEAVILDALRTLIGGLRDQ